MNASPQPKELDADLSPKHPTNKEASATRKLRFDAEKEAYVDEEGSLILDKFGQPY